MGRSQLSLTGGNAFAIAGGNGMTAPWQSAIYVLTIAFITGIGANLFFGNEDNGWVAPLDSYKQLFLWSRLIVLALAASLALRYHLKLAQVLWRGWPLPLACALIGLSSFWSLDSQQTFERFLFLVLALIFVAGIVSRNGLSSIAASFRILGWLTIFANIVLLAAQPDFAFSQDGYAENYRGLFIHKNELGIFSFCVMAVTLPSFFERRPARLHARDAILILGLFVTILISKSATSLILSTCVIVYSLFFWVVGRFKFAYWFNLGFFFLMSAISLLAIWFMQDTLLELIGRDATFTGRTQFWGPVVDAIQARPYVGYGFGAFWDSAGGAIAWFGDSWFPTHAHNGYLQNALDAGIPLVLVSLYMTILLQLHALRNAFDNVSPSNVFIALVAFTFPIYNLVETVFIRQDSEPTLLFMAAFLLSSLRRTRTVVSDRPLPTIALPPKPNMSTREIF